jgi:hypothetical protein
MRMRWSNITAGEIIEALSKAPRDYKVLNVVTGVVLDVNTDSIIFVNNYTINEYLGEPERYKILGHGEEEK